MKASSAALVGALALFDGAVAVAQTAPSATTPTPTQPAGKTPPAIAAAGSGPDVGLQALFEKTCSGCHDLSQATSQQNDEPGWKATIETMVGYGAQVSDADQVRIAHYLAATHGPAAAKP